MAETQRNMEEFKKMNNLDDSHYNGNHQSGYIIYPNSKKTSSRNSNNNPSAKNCNKSYRADIPAEVKGKISYRELLPRKTERNREKSLGKPIRSQQVFACRAGPLHSSKSEHLATIPQIIDWGESLLYRSILKGSSEFNSKNNPNIFYDAEVPYILAMLLQRDREIIISELYKPFFYKAKNTIFEICNEVMNTRLFSKIDMKHKTVYYFILISIRNHMNQR